MIIRCYQPADAALLHEAIMSSLDHLRPWMPWAKFEPTSLASKVDLVKKFQDDFCSGRDFVFGIFNNKETALLGSTGLHTRLEEDAREIGYWIHNDHIGNGYAQEAVKALNGVAFGIEKITRLEIHCSPFNKNSSRVAEKCGYTLKEVLKNKRIDLNGNPEDSQIWELQKMQYDAQVGNKTKFQAFDKEGALITSCK